MISLVVIISKDLYTFIPVSVTLTEFEGQHSIGEMLKMDTKMCRNIKEKIFVLDDIRH